MEDIVIPYNIALMANKKGYDLYIKPVSFVGVTLYYEIEIHHPKDVWDSPPKVKADTYKEVREACLKKIN